MIKTFIFALLISYANAQNIPYAKIPFRCSPSYGCADKPSERGFNFMEKTIEVWKDIPN
jgi:hypothetical protein